MSYPKSFSFLLQRMQNGYSRQTVKVYGLSSQSSASQGSTIAVALPPNTCIDMTTLQMHAKFSVNVPLGAAATCTWGLPRRAESVFASTWVEFGGAQVGPVLSGYQNVLHDILLDYTSNNSVNLRQALQFENFDAEKQSVGALQNVPVTFNHWLGFLGSSSPRYLFTGLLPEGRAYFRLAGPEILIKGGTAPVEALGFTLSDIYFTMDVVTVDDGMFESMLQKRLASGDTLEYVYDSYMVIPGSAGNPIIRGSIATQSLDMLLATLQKDGATAGAKDQSPDAITGASAYFTRGTANPSALTCFFQVNSQNYPNWPLTLQEQYANTLNQLCLTHEATTEAVPFASGYQADANGPTRGQYALITGYGKKRYVVAQRFCEPSDGGVPIMSGINTLGTNSYVNVQWNAIGANDIPLLFCKTKSSLKIGAGRQVMVQY